MSYLDPHGTPEPRGWERPGDQREPEWPAPDEARPRPWPGAVGPASGPYPATPADPPSFPYEPVRSEPPWPEPTRYEPAQYAYQQGIAPAEAERLDWADGPGARPDGGYGRPDDPASGGHHADPYRPGGGYEPRWGEPERREPDSYRPDWSAPGPDSYREAEPYRPDRPAPRDDPHRTPSPGEAAQDPPAEPATDPAAAEPATTATAGPTRKPGASRAGRNLPAAIGVGLALGALIVVPLFTYPPAFLVVVAAAATIGAWELARAVRQGIGANPPLPPLLAGGLLMVGLAWWAGPDALTLALLVTVLAVLVWRLGDGPRGYQRDMTAAALIAVYVPFLGGFAALLAATPGDGHLRVLVTLVAVVLSDTGGYAAGVTFGRHPMAPRVSPKKSWEGFGGSLAAAGVGSAILLWLLLDVSPVWGALFGLAVAVAAVLGDLAESMIKRDLGVKDMSTLLPGHGGVMDRLDSVLFAMPVAYLLLAIFVPAG